MKRFDVYALQASAVHNSEPPHPAPASCSPPLLGPHSSHHQAAWPCCMPSCSYEPQLLKKWSQKKQPIKTETAVTILHSMVLISLSFVFLPLSVCVCVCVSLTLCVCVCLQLPFPYATTLVLGPGIEQWIPFSSWEIRLESILSNQLQNKQNQGQTKTWGMSWESCHLRQVHFFFFTKTIAPALKFALSRAAICCQRVCLLSVGPTEAILCISALCLHLPLQMGPVLKTLPDYYLQ